MSRPRRNSFIICVLLLLPIAAIARAEPVEMTFSSREAVVEALATAILYAQGSNAKAGAYEYRINGHLLGGFAMMAWPARYGDTGIMTFLINQDQVIYQADLGPDTATVVQSISSFDPDKRWLPVADSDPGDSARTAAASAAD